MTRAAPCGDDDCPVRPPDPSLLRRVRGTSWTAGMALRRGHRTVHPADGLVPGRGDTRFAPLDATAHAYVAVEPVATLLESVLHDVDTVAPRIRHAAVRDWSESEVALTVDVRLADLTDPELDRLGVGRDELVATEPRHYACTRAWAAALRGRSVGGHVLGGIVWESRRQELHAAAVAGRPALSSMLTASDGRVAVLWSPPGPAGVLRRTGAGLGPLTGPEGDRFLTDLAALLGVVMTG